MSSSRSETDYSNIDRDAELVQAANTAERSDDPKSIKTDPIAIERFFMQALLKNVQSGVIYVDARNTILFWNSKMEQMTGIRGQTLFGKPWRPTKLNLSKNNADPVATVKCPAQEAMDTGENIHFVGEIVGRGGQKLKINFQSIPVADHHGNIYGAVMIFDDMTSEDDLKKQMEAWHARATLDPLTQVANRAELERTLEFLVRKNREKPLQCSIVICDIDFFKKINDDYGHHVGDQALISFARHIQQFTRPEDLFARYGGEEFVLICVNSDIETATNRAEELRVSLEATPQPHLDGKCIRASFGVAQMRKDDNATDFFVRADKALLKAKEFGRNQVVISAFDRASGTEKYESLRPGSVDIDRQKPGDILIDEELATQVPVDVIIAKLKGFVSEQDANIVEVESNLIKIQIFGLAGEQRRESDRENPMLLDLYISELNQNKPASTMRSGLRTIIRAARSRERRLSELQSYADKIKAELYSYLMISTSQNSSKIEPAATESGRLP